MKKVHVFLRLHMLVLLLLLLSGCAGAFAGGGWQAGSLPQQHIRALAVDPNNPFHIYAGDAQNGIFVSTDGGQHWVQQNAGFPLPATIVSLTFDSTGKKLYATTNTGVVVSTDAGQHWSPLRTAGTGLPVDTYTTLAFDMNAAHTIYAGTVHHGVLVSMNNGQTWISMTNGLPPAAAINDLVFNSENHQLWAATTAGIYRLDEGGTKWLALNNGLPAAMIVYAVQPASISGGAPGLIYAGTSHGFYRSQDAGAHWSANGENLAGTSIRSILIDFRQGQASSLFVATSVGVFSSSDGGQTWGGVAGGLPKEAQVYALAFAGDSYSQLFAAAADNVYLFPGNSGGFDIAHLFPIVLVVLFFYLLYRMTSRNRNRSREILKPGRIIEPFNHDDDQ
jgi:photosystem II stability/assembly factor-like uncharacterized protein